MNLIPTNWAMNHAPVTDATERVILTALANSSDSDGCNARRSTERLAALACTTPALARKKLASLQVRGFIRPQDDGGWEVMVPANYWSDVQLKDLNEWRNDMAGLPPITPESRPGFDAPPKPPLLPRCDDPRHESPNPYDRILDTEDGPLPCPNCHPTAITANGATDA